MTGGLYGFLLEVMVFSGGGAGRQENKKTRVMAAESTVCDFLCVK